MKGQVLHRARAHLKVPGWSLVWNELVTKKLPMFLSRLNEMSGGCENKVTCTLGARGFSCAVSGVGHVFIATDLENSSPRKCEFRRF